MKKISTLLVIVFSLMLSVTGLAQGYIFDLEKVNHLSVQELSDLVNNVHNEFGESDLEVQKLLKYQRSISENSSTNGSGSIFKGLGTEFFNHLRAPMDHFAFYPLLMAAVMSNELYQSLPDWLKEMCSLR